MSCQQLATCDIVSASPHLDAILNEIKVEGFASFVTEGGTTVASSLKVEHKGCLIATYAVTITLQECCVV